MNVDLDEARLVVSEMSLLKNSTLGLDSGLASSNEISHASSDRSINASRRLSALSSIHGGAPPVGEFSFLKSRIEKLIFYFSFKEFFLDETGSFDELDDSLIPRWFYEPSDHFNESSLLLHENLDCIIDQESLVQNSFQDIQASTYDPAREFVRPPPHLNYIKVRTR